MTGPTKAPPWQVATLAGLACLAYANSLSGAFVYDDLEAIVGNPTLTRFPSWRELLVPAGNPGGTLAGRPVLTLTFVLNRAVGGLAPWSYHALTVALHALAALVLFGALRRLFVHGRVSGSVMERGEDTSRGRRTVSADPFTAWLVALLWAAHPLLTQAVNYTVQRAEVLMSLWCLLSLYGFQRGAATDRSPSRQRWLTVSVAAAVLGVATKEVAVVIPILVLLYDRTFVAGSVGAALRARWRFYLALLSSWIVLAGLLLATGGNRGGTIGYNVDVPWWAYPLTQFNAVARYLALAAWPHPLVFEYGTFWVRDFEALAWTAVPVLCLLALGTYALVRNRPAGFAAAWAFGILAPTSLSPGTIQMIVEHRMYLPLAAVLALAVASLRRCIGRRLLLAGVVGALALAALTVRRNDDYRTPMRLWSDTVAKRPDNPRAHNGLAEAYEAAGDHAHALVERFEAARLNPLEARYHYNLALALGRNGRSADAVPRYLYALRIDPHQAWVHNNLAHTYGQLGAAEQAVHHYREAARLQPDTPLFQHNLGIALLRQGDTQSAVDAFERTLQLQPDHADARHNLGAALLELGRVEEARAIFAAIVTRSPRNADAQYGLGVALSALGRDRDAIPPLSTAVELQPEDANARFTLANALVKTGRIADAVPHYEHCVQLQPNDAVAFHNLGVAYARLDQWEAARTALETAIRLRPDYTEARQRLAQLQHSGR